ncbi:hypothetical protein Ahy_Scaffold1g107304 isoform H [Arachis hypogaea]|uniref:Uncharacterized protein n=1 Tax=Arachis hypogaea TaxID=3818 RepID=A0A444WVC9_ARAHY|nr:hypothetical protein Ahy_Scaffold1g107304 isoform H [Arachis hypogaea]
MLCAMLEKCHHQRNFRCIIKKSKFMVPKVIKQGETYVAIFCKLKGKWMELLCIKQWISGLLPILFILVSYSLKAALMVNYDLAGPSFCPP